jgi:hypothetical protein
MDDADRERLGRMYLLEDKIVDAAAEVGLDELESHDLIGAVCERIIRVLGTPSARSERLGALMDAHSSDREEFVRALVRSVPGSET